jgi:iron complex transport system substrate-binding protein
MPCGYDASKASREFSELSLPSGWADLPAVKTRRLFAVNANSYFSRPGPRLTDGLEMMARLLWSGMRTREGVAGEAEAVPLFP